MEFLEAVTRRRSQYSISKETPVSDKEIIDLVKRLITVVPSAYNSQSARVVLLFGRRHDRLWNIVLETLRAHAPPEKFGPTEAKIAEFAHGYGTILYFDDTAVTSGFATQFPRYRDNFLPWAEQANGMLQFAVWTALEERGLGASRQHYNQIIDDQVHEVFAIPNNWRLIAQMPFGKPTAPPLPVDKVSAEERMMVLK